MKKNRLAAAVAFACAAVALPAAAETAAKHVLLISVDGLHQQDLEWYVKNHPASTLATLVDGGTSYTEARTPFPSDSFPGMVGQVTGGHPSSTGIYYDDAYSRILLPAGTTSCPAGTPLGAEVQYAENIDKDLNRLDAGQGIPGLYGDFSLISQLAQPAALIDPSQLPVDPATCTPVYPHQYLLVNTMFEVAKKHGLTTAWSDKHPAYEILSGPSGKGVDEYFTPEINSSVTDPSLPAGPGPDFTKDNTNTQRYDALKVAAVLNWLNGLDHTGSKAAAVPAIFGMNFQAVSTAQKLDLSNYYTNPANPATFVAGGLGGYTGNGYVPDVVLQSALDFVDLKLGALVNAANRHDTVVVLSAKHGQSPTNRADLTIINDGTMIDALNAAWDPALATDGKAPLVAHAMDDDGVLLWLNDRSEKALSFVVSFLNGYSGTGIGSDTAGNKIPKPFVRAGLKRIYAGAEAREFMGTHRGDARVPDVIGVAVTGSVYAGGKLSKIAEHGGNDVNDRHVPIVVWGAGVHHRVVHDAVETVQIAPTVLGLLGLDARELEAVRIEGTSALPGLR